MTAGFPNSTLAHGRSIVAAGRARPVPSHAASDFPLRKLAFLLGLALVFLRVSMLAQIQYRVMHVDLKLLYVIGIPAMLGLVLAGGVARSFRGRPAYYYGAFAVWVMLATPFSSWKGGSFQVLWTYVRTDLVILFVVAGLPFNWKECRLLLRAVALAAAVNLASAKLFSTPNAAWGYRLGLDFGSLANPNDFAGHLLLVVPFLLWVALSAGTFPTRALAFGAVLFGLKLMLSTASRGALVGLSAEVLVFFWRCSPRQRVAVLMLLPVAAVGVTAFVSESALRRLSVFSTNRYAMDTDEEAEAAASAEVRRYGFEKSIEYIKQFPVLGVGPGQFASYEGRHNLVVGGYRGRWIETHNTYTQMASECGIPALLLTIGGIVSTFRLLSTTHKLTARRPEFREIHSAALCLITGLSGFIVAINFLNFAYFFYLPAMGGFAVLLHYCARLELAKTVEQPAA